MNIKLTILFSHPHLCFTSVELTTTIKMVNIFGNEAVRGRKGDRGPSGPRGRPGQKEDSCMWTRNTVLKSLELYDDKGCFFIDDLSTDIERDEKKISLHGYLEQ